MKKRLLVICVVIIMTLGILCGCEPWIIEKRDNDMIELHTWHFTSGIHNNAIVLNYSDSSAIFECKTDRGSLFSYNDMKSAKDMNVNSGETIYWDEWNAELKEHEEPEYAYIEIKIKIDDIIVGYAVIEVKRDLPPYDDYKAKVLKSAVFPKIKGEYQDVSEEYVNSRIEKIKGGK